jgi:hypothetical protein
MMLYFQQNIFRKIHILMDPSDISTQTRNRKRENPSLLKTFDICWSLQYSNDILGNFCHNDTLK